MASSLHPQAFRSGISSFPSPVSDVTLVSQKVDATSSADAVTATSTRTSKKPHEKPSLFSRLFRRNRVGDQPREGCDGGAGGDCDNNSQELSKSRLLFVNDVRRTMAYAAYMQKNHHGDPYWTNTVCSSKYTTLNFLPKSLFEQFRRVANFYFLIISLLQLCTNLSPTNEYSTIGPLMLVLTATMIKEGLEDRARHQQDWIVNHGKVETLNGELEVGGKKNAQPADEFSRTLQLGDFQAIFWKNLRVGHVVKIHDQEQVPADIVILFSSQDNGEAMCETSSLDGESNLKVRHCVKWSQIVPRSPKDFADTIHGEIRCEAPNKRLYSFDGVMRISHSRLQVVGEPPAPAVQSRPIEEVQTSQGSTPAAEEIPITIENVLLRGMKLCNTKWVVGVVVGGGNDTKLVQNMKAIPSKFSRLDRIANRCIFLIFSVLFGVCCFSSVQAALFAIKVHNKPSYAAAVPYIEKFHPAYFLEAWVTYLILYNNMVPISLYISLEVVKWYQAKRIENDPKMYCSTTGRGVTARTSNVNEDLGQIKYIFSDKTGTLTKNQMLFKVCSIGGIIFDGSNMHLRRAAQAGSDDLSGGSDMMIKLGSSSAVRGGSAGRDGSADGRRKSKHVSVTEKDVRSYTQMIKFVENPTRFSGKEVHAVELARPFFRCLLLCHSASVAVEESAASADQSGDTRSATGRTRSESADGSMRAESRRQSGVNSFTSNHAAGEASDAFPSLKGDRKFFGSSPDEVALLNAALEFDCVYERRDGDVIHIRLFGKSESYQLLALNEFDSTRKCMSVVVKKLNRDDSDGRRQDLKLARVRDTLGDLDHALETDLDALSSDSESEDQDILVFSKGADTVMFANACKDQDISKLALHVHYFAAMALRTLLLGYRTLSMAEYLEWKCEFDAAKKALSNREQLCVGVARQIEKSTRLLGATGVEDLLQDGVRECISQLSLGGINIWMLTGDKDETAISVAHMCGLIGPKSKMIIIKGKNKQDCLDEIAKARRKLKREGVWVPGVASQDISLVINGEALEHLLADALTSSTIKAQSSYVSSNQVAPHSSNTSHSDPAFHASATMDMLRSERDAHGGRLSRSMSSKSMGNLPFQAAQMVQNSRHRSSSRPGTTRSSITETNGGAQLAHELFLELASQCRTVVACRLSPMQKAQVVSLMKSAPGTPLTLAVGDGGNDVSMIQEAHVGIGIYGHEGMQAVRAADFAIVTFRDLSRLLLVHGRWNHRRVARVILFSFYKNMALIMTLFLFSFFNGYSGQTLYESYLMVGWNVLYTILPIFVLGITDEDIRDSAVMRFPFVYRSSLRRSELSIRGLSFWVVNALFHSLLVFVFVKNAMGMVSSRHSHANGLFPDGTAVYGALIITVTLKASLHMQCLHRWTRAHYISLFGGFVVYILFVAAYSQAYRMFPTFDVFRDFSGLAQILFSEMLFWVLLFFTSVTCICFDLTIMYLRKMYLPTSNDIILEIDSGLGELPTLPVRNADGSVDNRAAKLIYSSSGRSDEGSYAGIGTGIAAGGSARSEKGELAPSLLEGEWSQQFRDFDLPTEHDELSKQLVSIQRELAQEIGHPDPLSQEDDAHSSRALRVQPPVHPLTLEFMGEEHQRLEEEYEYTFAFRERSRVILCLKVMAFMIPLYAVYEVLWERETSYIWIRVGYFVCDLLFMRFARTRFFVQNYQLSILLPYSMIGMALTLTISDTGKFAAALYPVGLFVVIRVKFLYALMLSIYNFAFYMLADRLNSLDYENGVDVSDLMLFALYLVFVIAFGSYACYSLQITMRRDFLQSRSLLIEQKRSTQILKNMLPEHVVQRMQKGDTLISEDEQDVTILFCDIADFASFVNRFSPTEVVSLLDRVYSLFDQICQKHGVRKMETVGKTYMACAGLQGKDQGREAALRAVSMALDMLSCLEKCRASNGNGIKLRIGVHSGRVVSGLVGMKKQQFSLFGDTVNTASRMQSTGITGRCQISQVTYKKLVGHFSFEERQIDVKGKGSMTTYLVGDPLTDVAQMACLGQLEFSTKRDSVLMSQSVINVRRPFEQDFLVATRNRILHSARQRWKKYDPIRMLLGTPPDLASFGGTDTSESVEQHMLTEIRLLNMCFRDEEMENKYLENTLSDRVEGARTTLLALAVYASFTCMRDLLVEIFSVLSSDAPQKEISATMYVILLFIRSPFAIVAILVARRVRDEFVFYSEVKLRNVLLGFYLIGLFVFTLAEALLWGLNYKADIDTSPRYVNLCLDTVLAMFVVSNGRSILYRHVVVFNVLALVMVSITTLVSLQAYHQDAAKFNSKFKTSYPIVLTYFSVVANIIASQSVEFFTRRQIWLKTRTQLETMNADRLLYQMLPAAVVMRLKEGEMVCDQHQQVGILFSDIKGFTSIASQAATAQVVNILASLFCAFDKLTEKHGVFKMQTIGDAYVIVSGLPYVDMSLGPGLVTSSASTADMSNADASMSVAPAGSTGIPAGIASTLARLSSNRVLPLERKSEIIGNDGNPRGSGAKLRSHLLRRSTLKHKHQMHLRNHIHDLLAMARDMHKEVRKVQDPNTGERLQMRIGIHVGNIIGGVIGTTTLRYDMWGPDALTANELESNGVPEKILVSPIVQEVVKDMIDIRCTFHRKINFTNTPMMDTYLVEFIEPDGSGGKGGTAGSGGRINSGKQLNEPIRPGSVCSDDSKNHAGAGSEPT